MPVATPTGRPSAASVAGPSVRSGPDKASPLPWTDSAGGVDYIADRDNGRVVDPHVCGWNLGHSRCREDSERECGADASEYGRSLAMAGHDQCLDSAGREVHPGVFPRLRIASLQILCAPVVRARQNDPGGDQ